MYLRKNLKTFWSKKRNYSLFDMNLNDFIKFLLRFEWQQLSPFVKKFKGRPRVSFKSYMLILFLHFYFNNKFLSETIRELERNEKILHKIGLNKAPPKSTLSDFIKSLNENILRTVLTTLNYYLDKIDNTKKEVFAIDAVVATNEVKTMYKTYKTDTKKGIQKKVNGIKTTVLVNTDNEIPIDFTFSYLNEHEAIKTLYLNFGKPKYIVADKGFSSNKIRSTLLINGILPIIPKKKNEIDFNDFRKREFIYNPKLEKKIYKKRTAVERVFSKIESSLKLEKMRFKHIRSYFAMIGIALSYVVIARIFYVKEFVAQKRIYNF